MTRPALFRRRPGVRRERSFARLLALSVTGDLDAVGAAADHVTRLGSPFGVLGWLRL
jgi:hypothetical protein